MSVDSEKIGVDIGITDALDNMQIIEKGKKIPRWFWMSGVSVNAGYI